MKSKSAKRIAFDTVKREEKRRKLQALAERPGTVEEGDAARRAMARLDAGGDGLDDGMADFLVQWQERIAAIHTAPQPKAGPESGASKEHQAWAAKGAAKDQDADRKRPVHLNNDFVRRLTGAEMWWDDDRKATGFGV